MNKKLTQILYFLILSASLSLAQAVRLQVCDIWSGLPLSSVRIICGADTLFTDESGSVSKVSLLCPAGKYKIEKAGYFRAEPQGLKSAGGIIYLIPVENAEAITVVAPPATEDRLAIPAHISAINLASGKDDFSLDLAEIAGSQSGLHIKSYGAAGQLQTISVRGMAASQTRFLFDGIPLNSLQLGSVNLAQYELQNLGALEIYRGGSALFGGGAIGGTVNIHPLMPQNKLGGRVELRRASFRNEAVAAGLNIPLGRLSQRFFFSRSSAENRYPAKFEGSSVILRNRDFRSREMAHQARFKISNKAHVSSYLSSRQYRGGSPKPFTGPAAEAANAARSTLDNTFFKIKAGYFSGRGSFSLQGYVRNEWMSYADPSLKINNKTLYDLYFNQEKGAQLRGRWLPLSDLLLSAGAELSLQRVKGSNVGRQRRNNTAVYLLSDYEILRNRLFLSSMHVNGSLRLEKYGARETLLLPAAGLTAQWPDWQVYFSLGRNYRAPTFNDLYWQNGGNPALLPEKSVNSEAGIQYRSSRKFIKWQLLVSGFMNRVRNQIQWLPAEAFWQPQNIASVFSRGVEVEGKVAHANGKHLVAFNYTLMLAEKEQATVEDDRTVGNQLPYQPREQWNLATQSGWKSWRIGTQISYSSFRYKTIQNEARDILPSYTSARLWSSFAFEYRDLLFTLRASVENLQDVKYEVMAGYPMPPRNYRLALEIKY